MLRRRSFTRRYELEQLLEQFKGDGNDNLFALYLQDMYDKKADREGKAQPTQIGGICSANPNSRPYQCYEEQVLKRDTPELKKAYDQYYTSDFNKFNEILEELTNKKAEYYKVRLQE